MSASSKTGTRGRPRIDDEPLVQINVRITRDDLDWLDATSDSEGRIGRNAVIRKLIRDARRQSGD